MKMLIFENEFTYLDTAFRYVNKLYFNGDLKFEVFASSQEFKSFENINKYDIVIVDISLSKKSELDGYGLLKKLIELGFDKSKIIIMTGNHQIKLGLSERGLEFDYIILTKPIDIYELRDALNLVSQNVADTSV